MKKILTSFLLSAAMLFAGLTANAATKYCQSPIEEDGVTKALLSIENVQGNSYRVTVAMPNDEVILGVNLANVGVDQTAGAGMALAVWEVADDAHSIACTFTTASEESVPTSFYTDHMFLNIEGQGEINFHFNAIDVDWTNVCDGGSEEPVPAAGTVDFFVPGDGSTASAADLQYELPTAADVSGTYTKGKVTVELIDAPGAQYLNHSYVADASNPVPHIRLYAGNQIKVSVKDAVLTKVEWSIVKSSKGAPTASEGEVSGDGTAAGSVVTWTGSVTDGSVTFDAVKQLRFSHMVVTYEAKGGDDPEKPAILSAVVSDITQTSAKLTFDATDNVRSGKVFNGEIELASVDAPEVVISGLTPATTYNLTAVVYDEVGTASEVFNVPEFTTLAAGELGTNLALNKPITAGHSASDEYRPELANDGQLNDQRWASGGAANHDATGVNSEDWIAVDLGAVYDISLVKIWFERANPSDYSILVSNNGAIWTEVGNYNTESKFGNTAEDVNEYEFTNAVGRYVKVLARAGFADLAYGISIYELEVYGTAAVVDDTTKPVMGEATLVSVGMDNAVIAVSGATDDNPAGVVGYRVIYHDMETEVSLILAPDADNHITVTGLEGGRTFDLHIAAVDAAGNVSGNEVLIMVNTTADTTRPTSAPDAPKYAAENVKALYCNSYPVDPGWGYYENWGQSTRFEELGFDGNTVLYYSNFNYQGWGCGGMLDASDMKYLHLDIWADQDGELGIVPISDAGVNTNDRRRYVAQVKGQQWVSVDIELESAFGGEDALDFAKINQFKFDNGTITNFAIDNALFWKPDGSETALQMLELTGVRFANNIVYNQNNLRMEIFNVQGKKVADTTADFDMSNMPHGVYMIRANNAVLKVVK